ncbi:hypothetical protein ACUHMQ_19945 [Chitinimonas sp. PSY-7]|uniref:hypothetical protein n=1 Tax=Chitinimonas sp. PSY-7 TaxID=3459088 RepID=UPI00404012D4
MQRNLSREAHLWYTITSPAHTDRACSHLQDAFDFLMAHIKGYPSISDYPPVPYWGGRTEELLQRYAHARHLLKGCEYGEMISWCESLGDIQRGFDEGNMSWMGPDADVFIGKLNAAYSIGSDFCTALAMSQRYCGDAYKHNTQPDWKSDHLTDISVPGNDIACYYEEAVFPDLPEQIPEYQADTSLTCKTGGIVPWTGVWVPATGMGTAALVFAREGVQVMQPAYEVVRRDDVDDYVTEFKPVETTFHPVRPTGRLIALVEHSTKAEENLLCDPGQPCPHPGYWFIPTRVNSRRAFQQGEPMPYVESGRGAAIWQWDTQQ